MPINKNATIRYQALDKCFSDFRHRYYIDDLIDASAEALIEYTGHDSMSRRTVFEDITFMESEQGWSIPLERHKDGKKVYYRYKYKDFSINNQELTADEISQLKTTILTISLSIILAMRSSLCSVKPIERYITGVTVRITMPTR